MIINWINTILWAVFAVIAVFFLLSNKKRQVRKQIAYVRDYFNKVKSMPIKARLERVQSIAFVDRNFQTGSDVWKYRYDKEYAKLEKDIKEKISFIETLVPKQKTTELLEMIEGVKEKVELFEEKSSSLLAEIENFIKLEGMLRNEATFYKRLLRNSIDIFESKRSLAKNSAAHIDALIKEIEKIFEDFEASMSKVKFQKATLQIHNLQTKITELLNKINIATNIQLFSKKIIPNYIDKTAEELNKAQENHSKLDYPRLINKLKESKQSLQAIEIISKMKNFASTKKTIEETLKNINLVDQEIWNETKSKEIYFEMLPVWKKEIRKFYVITNDLNPLIATMKQRVQLTNEDNAMILAYKETLEEAKKHEKAFTSKLDKAPDHQFKILLGYLKNSTQNIIKTINLVRKVYDVLEKKESKDIRSEREVVSLGMSYSELSSDIQNNKFVKGDEKTNQAMKHLKEKINETKKLQSKFPRDIKEIQDKIELCVKITKQIAENFYTTKERYKIAENKIMWMSKYRFLSNAKDLDALLNEAEIAFNNFDLTKLENILNIASETTVIKENMGK